MHILQINELPDCFEQSSVKEIVFDSPITQVFIDKLPKYGKLDYYPNFPRPFYKLTAELYFLQGVQGETRARLTLDRHQKDVSLEKFMSDIQDLFSNI